ncbi:MAG: sigma-70 family RNA polymerase sigma factor [Cyclobacteriaceae bacterium]|mgnify:CR=1 FL=1|nr:sigma-70 family RNA polymerase sigma factor [Cyclobacteriaceae bacterium]
METKEIWDRFGNSLFLFIFKKVNNADLAKDILQTTFLKIHKNLYLLKNQKKVKPWIFRIADNEIKNLYKKATLNVVNFQDFAEVEQEIQGWTCCFDRFINELPDHYKEIIDLVYVRGLKQKKVAEISGISLENVKARIKRSKELLKHKFKDCCGYQLNKKGMLIGESDCPICS